MTVTMNRPLATFILVSCCLTVWASTAEAERPKPLDRAGRLFGAGWGDGYHACESSGIRPLADLPPRSNLNRSKPTHSFKPSLPISHTPPTFYDRFDAAKPECDSCDGYLSGCDSCASNEGSTMTIINGSEVVQLRQQPTAIASYPVPIRPTGPTTERVENRVPIRPSFGRNNHNQVIAVPAGARKLKFGFDQLSLSMLSAIPRPSTTTPTPITVPLAEMLSQTTGNVSSTGNVSVTDATLTKTALMSSHTPRAVIRGFSPVNQKADSNLNSSPSNHRQATSANRPKAAKPRPVRLYIPGAKKSSQANSTGSADSNSNASVFARSESS